MKDTPTESRIISIRTSRVENFAQLSVSDRGSGIPGDKLKEVFEPFFTSKAEGMGMGLSIARTIIEAHKGRHLTAAHCSGSGFHLKGSDERRFEARAPPPSPKATRFFHQTLIYLKPSGGRRPQARSA